MIKKNSILSYARLFVGAGILCAALCLGFLFFIFRYPCVDFSVLARYQQGKPSIVYDDQGKEWARFQLDRRDPVALKDMPQHLIQAFIAAEDWSFFSHNGLSWRGIARSLWVNLSHGRIVQGASTITQQLVKMLFYDNQRTFKRKIKEQFLTLLVERQFTKEHILETYLNHVYFGSGMYGVGAATQRFWGISVAGLSVEQSAMLAAIMCSPGHYSPLFFPYSAANRRNVVLSKMKKLGFITLQQMEEARSKPLALVAAQASEVAPYVKEYVRAVVETVVGKEQLYTGGLSIRTTLNIEMQRAAQKVFSEECAKLRKLYGADLDGALLSVGCKTGAIKAMIGGFDFSQSQFNRALYAKRQQGSIFKPVLYATALEQEMSLLDTVVDEPFAIKQGATLWQPRNYNRQFAGEMTLARALSYSNNVVSAKIIMHLGVECVIDAATRCHVQAKLQPYPSLALGCLDSTLMEVVGMFNVFANQGMYCEPHLVSWVKDSWGKTIYRATHVKERVFSTRSASQIAHVLTAGLERKKKYARTWIDSSALSKTGTTNESRTCWFAGSTPEVTTVVYIGCDDNRPMGKNVFPLHTAYPIWLNFHSLVPTTQKQFMFDASLKEFLADWKTGEIVTRLCPGKEILPVLL